MVCIGPFSHHWHKIPDSLDLKDEKFNLVQGFGPWLSDSRAGTSWQKGLVKQWCLVHVSWETEQGAVPERKESETRYCIQGHIALTHPDTPRRVLGVSLI